MSVEQTTQLIQLILNSVLMSVACALVLGGLTARHAAIGQQLQAGNREDAGSEGSGMTMTGATQLPRGRFSRKQLHRLRYRYQIARYSVLSAYYALLFSGLSCFALVVRGLLDWNVLIPVSLGFFVGGVATLLVAVSLTLIDWHLSDRALLDEVQKLLTFGQDTAFIPVRSRYRTGGNESDPKRRDRSKVRVS
jgi:hypothetical protein